MERFILAVAFVYLEPFAMQCLQIIFGVLEFYYFTQVLRLIFPPPHLPHRSLLEPIFHTFIVAWFLD